MCLIRKDGIIFSLTTRDLKNLCSPKVTGIFLCLKVVLESKVLLLNVHAIVETISLNEIISLLPPLLSHDCHLMSYISVEIIQQSLDHVGMY